MRYRQIHRRGHDYARLLRLSAAALAACAWMQEFRQRTIAASTSPEGWHTACLGNQAVQARSARPDGAQPEFSSNRAAVQGVCIIASPVLLKKFFDKLIGLLLVKIGVVARAPRERA